MNPRAIVIIVECGVLWLEIKIVPEEKVIEELAPYRANEPFDEAMVYYHQAMAFTRQAPGSNAEISRTARERLAGIGLVRREVSTVPREKSSSRRQT